MPDAELSRVLHRTGLPRVTIKTKNSVASLRGDLQAARGRGYAIDDEEHAVGLRCIASAVFDEAGEAIAAISLSGPMARIADERIPVLGAMVRQRADLITAQVGGCLPPWRGGGSDGVG
jgi:IclR family acetate operon transcriptional repressor